MRGDTQTGKTMQSQCDMSQGEVDWIAFTVCQNALLTKLGLKCR